MSTTTANRKPATIARDQITPALVTLFNAIGVRSLSVNFARDLGAAYGLNKTTAELCFYRWRRGVFGTPAQA